MKTEVNNSQIPHGFSTKFGLKVERIELYISISLFSEIEMYRRQTIQTGASVCINLKLIQLFLL